MYNRGEMTRAALPQGVGGSTAPKGVGRQVVSAEQVAVAIHGAAHVRQATRLSDEDYRCALAMAAGLEEMASEAARGIGTSVDAALWSIDLPIDEAALLRLGGLAGATSQQVSRGLTVLLASQVVLRTPGTSASVRLSHDVVATVAGARPEIDWQSIRGAMRARRFGVMPALAVLREFVDAPVDGDGWTVTTYEQLAGRTFFKRSTVARACADLESVGVIERARGPGFRGHYRILAEPSRSSYPPLPDRVGAPPASAAPTPREVPPAEQQAPLASVSRAPDPDSAPAAAFATLEVNGVGFPIPAGVVLVPEFDPQGRLWYRLGTARIGPIRM